MSDPIADAAQKHPAPEGLVYTYGTAGVSGLPWSRNAQLTKTHSSVPKRKLAHLALIALVRLFDPTTGS